MSFHISKGVYCEDCQYVSDARGTICGACGSKAIVNLQNLIEHRLEPEPLSVSELERMAK